MISERIDFVDPHDPIGPRLRHVFGRPSRVLVAHTLAQVRPLLDAVQSAALQKVQPGGYAVHLDTGEQQLLSLSPELIFDWRDGQLLAQPMKGTAARGDTPERDAAQAERLRTSVKERAENVMVVDLLRIAGRWLTPPLQCGLLGGIARAQALAEGKITEAVLRLEDLPQVEELTFFNSLRVWLPADLKTEF